MVISWVERVGRSVDSGFSNVYVHTYFSSSIPLLETIPIKLTIKLIVFYCLYIYLYSCTYVCTYESKQNN